MTNLGKSSALDPVTTVSLSIAHRRIRRDTDHRVSALKIHRRADGLRSIRRGRRQQEELRVRPTQHHSRRHERPAVPEQQAGMQGDGSEDGRKGEGIVLVLCHAP